MLARVHLFRLLLRLQPPEQENYSLPLLVYHIYHLICELLPALLLVGVGLAFSDCEHPIQQEHSLPRPVR